MSTVYVAFLRGINVGGHNIVPKVELLKVFVSQGYQNVLVYKQSGNVNVCAVIDFSFYDYSYSPIISN